MQTVDSLTIWTIGHSTRSKDEFVDLLKENEIRTLADVRSFPGSRKFPHFNAEALVVSLPAAGIEYIPFKQLGDAGKLAQIRRTLSGETPRFAAMPITWTRTTLRKVSRNL